MANFTETTNYSFKKPTVGADTDQWGTHINETIDGVDSQLKTLADSITSQQLEQLGNVVNVTPVDDQFLRYNGTNWTAETVSIPDVLNDLSNVSGTPSSGDVLTYNGSAWTPASVTSAAVADGSVTNAKLHPSLQTVIGRILVTDDNDSPTDNQILVYSTSDAEWKYADQAGSTLQTLTDVSTTGLSDGDLMKYDGTAGEFVFIDAAAARTLLNVDVSGTDNSTATSLNTTSHDYLTLSSQQITLGPIVLTDDVSGTLPIANGGTSATTAAGARTALGLVISTNIQAFDQGLQSISSLTTAADKMLYTTASDTYAVTDLTAFARTILDDADAATVRTTLGLDSAATTPSSDYATAAQGALADSATQPGDAATTLNVSATDKLLGRSTAGAGSVEEITLTSAGRALLDDADAAAQRTTLGLGSAALSASGDFETAGSVSTHAALTSSVHGISSFGATLVDDADASAARTTLGLGTISTQASDSVSITGGSVTGITDLAIADGGTGASSVSVARSNLLPNYSGNGSKVLALNSGGTDVEWVTQSQVFTAGVANAFEHANSISDSITVTSSNNRLYMGDTTFSGTLTIQGKLVILDGPINLTSTMNVTGTLSVRH